MVVSIAGQGAMPTTTTVATASFSWQTLHLPLLASEDGVEALKAALPEPFARRQTLLRVALSGRARLNGRTAMTSLLQQVAPEFAHLEIDTELLGTDCESDDLEIIDRAGALRDTADLLLAESLDQSRSGDDRRVAREALIRLFSYCEAIDR